ncbi:DUF2867 domain-containing protein [Nocardia cyriacigeorgica]|uniref:DUF2867 domain-containing protein n=1 Tax=Nocardia cyriacigeorgica TaxID=135487 RepID=A0A6P1D9Y7_9NOCA|nr:DUF2867 domain-containing protein [Nocardia cyriacigeorgica]NEW45700.1 DUF2867 domain-containing protein [Nocardia cyriacigeorgica]
MKLPAAEHTSRSWRIHDIAPDFQVEDVWALATPGGPDDFPRLVRTFLSDDPAGDPLLFRMLFAVRWRIGKIFKLDDPGSGISALAPTLRDRLPSDLRDLPPGPEFPTVPFTSLYLTENEWAAEVANRTVHAVMHMGWVPEEGDRYRGQMTVLVKPNGLLGKSYMAAIAPFRSFVLFPSMLRGTERRWQTCAE